jgi:hypothetical protein
MRIQLSHQPRTHSHAAYLSLNTHCHNLTLTRSLNAHIATAIECVVDVDSGGADAAAQCRPYACNVSIFVVLSVVVVVVAVVALFLLHRFSLIDTVTIYACERRIVRGRRPSRGGAVCESRRRQDARTGQAAAPALRTICEWRGESER